MVAASPHFINTLRFSPSFLWKEVPRRGGGWLREAIFSHAGMPTPPRFARLPLPEEGARMILDRALPTYNCGEAATSALNSEPKSPVTPSSKKPEHASSVFWLFYWREATPSFFISPTAGAHRKALPCREAWLCIEICRRSAAVMGSALPPRPPFPRLRPYVIIYLRKR